MLTCSHDPAANNHDDDGDQDPEGDHDQNDGNGDDELSARHCAPTPLPWANRGQTDAHTQTRRRTHKHTQNKNQQKTRTHAQTRPQKKMGRRGRRRKTISPRKNIPREKFHPELFCQVIFLSTEGVLKNKCSIFCPVCGCLH